MTQEQALIEFQKLRPESVELSVERDRKIGAQQDNRYYLWDGGSIVASSHRSWGHALAVLRVEMDFPVPQPDAPLEDEVSA